MPGSPRRCNCIVWALYRWMRRGGYVAFRRSDYVAVLPHFLWSSTRRYWWGYVPVKPRSGIAGLIDGVWFKGRVWLEAKRKRPR